jgi:hypothetical protein
MKKLTFLVIAACSMLNVFAQAPINLFDGESVDSVHVRFRSASGQAIELVDNPLKDAVNTSNKVIRMTPVVETGNTTPGNRCILNLDMIRNQTGDDVLYTYGYTNIKLKYYSPNVRGNEIKMQWNASTTLPTVSVFPEGGKWETLDFTFPYDDEDYAVFQIIFNENKSWGTGDFLMYIDDVAVYNVNYTGIEELQLEKFKCHSYIKAGKSVLVLSADNLTDTNIQLYSLSGQKVKDLYHGDINNTLELPVDVVKGLYFIRILSGNASKVLKLIVE